MTTLLKRSKTGLIAMAGSMQLIWHLRMRLKEGRPETYTKWKTGFGTDALSVSNGSRMSRKPRDHAVNGTINRANVNTLFVS
jgi:hypothetical protein